MELSLTAVEARWRLVLSLPGGTCWPQGGSGGGRPPVPACRRRDGWPPAPRSSFPRGRWLLAGSRRAAWRGKEVVTSRLAFPQPRDRNRGTAGGARGFPVARPPRGGFGGHTVSCWRVGVCWAAVAAERLRSGPGALVRESFSGLVGLALRGSGQGCTSVALAFVSRC